MRTPEVIWEELSQEQNKLIQMDRQDPATYEQSCLVDGLINEYYRALFEEQKKAV